MVDGSAFEYPGDLPMARLLAEVGCPRRLAECRALLRGAAAAQKQPLLSVLVRELFCGRAPAFRNLGQADTFLGSLLALYRSLEDRFAAAHWRNEVEGPSSPSVGSLEDRARACCAEVESFLRGLDLGATDRDSLDEEGKEALSTLTQASAYLRAIAGLAATQAPSQPHLQSLTDQSVLELETLSLEKMIAIEASLRRLRPAGGARPPDAGVGPNDLCPCGSERPRKRCCEAPT